MRRRPRTVSAAEALPLVACLCAEWCGVCRDYRAAFGAVAAHFAGRARFAWIDVEDEAEVLGEFEITDFPTLLILSAEGVAFCGPVEPQPAAAVRLVHRAVHGDLGVQGDAQARALAARLLRRVESNPL